MKKTILTVDRRNWLILLLILIVTFVPFLGEALFNTKGEPREAIVALSMLQQGDWILPESYGGDIPYKPPFFAWCIAVASCVLGGEVTEFSSRLPSAIALIIMVMTAYTVNRRELRQVGSAALPLGVSVLTFTAFEVFRAGYACRVDMVLTACIVCSIYALFCYYRSGKVWLLPVAVMLMSGAVLTKGPIGAVLPCLVIGVYRLCDGKRFWKVFFSMVAIGALSLVLPALWYVAAYQRGGQEFLDLAMEENFGRLLGTMSYESHSNPAWYNVVTLISGFLPYTLLLLFTLLCMKWRPKKCQLPVGLWIREKWNRFLAMSPLSRLSAISAILIFLFYCIPDSKRSVYLLPVYPFVAYFIALYLRRAESFAPRAIRIYAFIIGFIAILAPVLLAAIKFGVLDGVGSDSMKRFIVGLKNEEVGITGILILALSIWTGLVMIYDVVKKNVRNTLIKTCATIIVIYWSFAAIYQPAVLNVKSDKPVADLLESLYSDEPYIYTLVDDPMLRFYTLNFYMRDRMRRFDEVLPQEGHLVVGHKHSEKLLPKYEAEYEFHLELDSLHRSCDVKQQIQVYGFKRK